MPFAPLRRCVGDPRLRFEPDVAQTLVGRILSRAARRAMRGRIVVLASRPSRRGAPATAIEIDIVAGYGDAAADTPEPLRRAILALVAHWHENRGDVSGDVGAPCRRSCVALAKPFRRERLT